MLSFYLFSAVLGGILVGFSAFFGADDGHDTDTDTDTDSTHDSDSDSGGTWLALLSLRFWTYTLGALGTTGALLTWLTGLGSFAVLTAAIGTGLLAGFSISTLMRLLKRSESSSLPERANLLGAGARVLVTVRPHETGKVRLDVNGELVDLLAVSDAEHTLEAGTQVIIVALEGDKARVIQHA
jgi:membrane protein implicated in regulation of membrane protease activity